MKKYLIILFISIFFFPSFSQAQVKKVTVEKYYVSDANDATDVTAGKSLDSGSVTYRVFVQLLPGYKLKKMYGDSSHVMRITSTADFFNNVDRPAANFGYLINKTWFQDNPTLALDSWITLGLATKTNKGILKSEDTDDSFIGGTNNTGGSAVIPGGLLVNNNPAAGIPLTSADGLFPNNEVLSQWLDNGFKDMASGDDTTVFGSIVTGSQFISYKASLQQNSGVMGATPDSNQVLVAQLTTLGEISFQLNLELIDSSGVPVNLVSGGSTYSSAQHDHDTILCPLLSYPPECGCMDPHFLEYSSNYACNIQDSCRTKIIFGCMDTMACNYNPGANFHLVNLCCYPGHCNDRDISVVCPTINTNRVRLYPNPAQEDMSLQVTSDTDQESSYYVIDSFGRIMMEKNIQVPSGTSTLHIDVSELNIGVYMLRVHMGKDIVGKTFVKN